MEQDFESITKLPDGTVTFLPNRLNRQPIVVLGLTANELFIIGAGSVVVGLILGIPIAFLTKSFAMVPTTMLATGAVGLYVGGTILRRMKRGRPDEWFYRNLQWTLGNHWPFLITWIGGRELIRRSGLWFHRRGVK